MSYSRLLLVVPLILLAACNINQPNNPTPTVEILISPTPTATRTDTPVPSATPSPQVEMQTPIVLATQPLDNVPNVPTMGATAAPLETPTPWSYTIKAGDTLGGILSIQPWGYNGYDPAIQQATIRLNNMRSADFIPPPGATLLIPQRTWTPIPEGAVSTQAAAGEMGCSNVVGNLCLPPGEIACYNVEEGDSILGISGDFSVSLELLSALNPNLNWGGCVFTDPMGGPSCAPFIRPGDCVKVPQPTAVPSYTPTASGSETPTPTPTRPAAMLVFPPDGAIIPAGTFELQWVSAGILAQDQVYLVEVQDVTGGTPAWLQVTRDTSMELPGTLIPTDGQVHQFQWRVTVVKKVPEGGTYTVSDGQGGWRPFQWQSR